MERPNGTKGARIIRVIETRAKRGLGIEKDPVRDVIQYWDLDGNFLAECDQDPQYLAELSIWESKRLSEIIQSSVNRRHPQD